MKKSRPVARNSLWCLSHATLNVVLFGGAGVAAALSATCGLLRQSVRSALGTGFGVWYGALLRRLRTAIKRTGVEAVGPRVHPGSASVDFELEISDVRSTCASLFLFYEASVLQDDAKVVFRPVGHALGSQGGLTCRLVHPLSLFFNTTSGATLALKRPGGGGPHSLLQTSAVGRLLVEGERAPAGGRGGRLPTGEDLAVRVCPPARLCAVFRGRIDAGAQGSPRARVRRRAPGRGQKRVGPVREPVRDPRPVSGLESGRCHEARPDADAELQQFPQGLQGLLHQPSVPGAERAGGLRATAIVGFAAVLRARPGAARGCKPSSASAPRTTSCRRPSWKRR